jgi:hypothetical protein
MSKQKMPSIILFSFLIALVLSALPYTAWANSPFTQIQYTFDSYQYRDLDWYDAADDYSTGSTQLGFSVTIGGATYDRFDMDSNGYVELLSGAQDAPTGYGYGSITDLINDDPASTYLLAAYDDLDSGDMAFSSYYGYKLYADRAVFYYNTETYADSGSDMLNEFEIILYKNGDVQWNFGYAGYSSYDYDLYSGLYFGNTGTLLELTRDNIPFAKSYYYTNAVAPEPVSSALFMVGAGVMGIRRWRKSGFRG